MISQKKILVIISILLSLTLACNLGTPAPQESDDQIATSVAMTVAAQNPVQPPPAVDEPPAEPQLATMTPSIVPSPTIALSATPSIPIASVSLDTNCRTGPGKAYDILGALTVGETAEVVGKNTSSDYWIIENPDRNGTCWLWGQYATIAGDTSKLPEVAVPPTPTPAIPNAPSNFAAATACVAAAPPHFMISVDLIWIDNSDNENGFYIYYNGVIDVGIPIDETHATFDFPVVDSVPVELGLSAFNATGVSAIQTVQVVCP